MKLESIIYDTTTLNSALTEALIAESPTFNAMYPSETASSLVNTLSGVGAMLQYTLVSSLANCFTDSAYSPSGIYQLAETLGNRLHGNISSTVICDVERLNGRGRNLIIPAESNFTINGLNFFNKYAISFSALSNKVQNVVLIQGNIVETSLITSGISGEKLYFSEDFKADITNNIEVYINGEQWSIAESFISYDVISTTDDDSLKVVVVRMNSEGQAYIKLGNGSNGLLPQSGSTVKVKYVSNEGSAGNILKNNLNIELTSIIYNNDETNSVLELAFPKSSTAYGGSNTQSLETLKESSPYVFAAGDRAVRRSDYTSILLNKCGYSSANVWGEYEEAQYFGTYNKIMMNMVYYTGIKSFQTYNYLNIGSLTSNTEFTGSLSTTKPFYGSVNIKLVNLNDPENYIIYEDNGGKGLLFNNDNSQFDLDNLYDYISQEKVTLNLVDPTDVSNNRVISNIINNGESQDLYYESGHNPSVGAPVQIRLDFEEAVALAGIKFYIPAGDNIFIQNSIGSFAIYGTNTPITHLVNNEEVLNQSLYINIRNNTTDWTRVVTRTLFNAPNLGEWSNWYASSIYSPNELDENNIWKKFKHYVIEVYSLNDNSTINTLKLGKTKILLNSITEGNTEKQQISTINYEDNGSLKLIIPSLNNTIPDFYKYIITPTNLKTSLGYHLNDVLTYNYNSNKYDYSATVYNNLSGTGYAVGDVVRLVTAGSVDTGIRFKVTKVLNGVVIAGELLTLSGTVEYNGLFNTVVETKTLASLTANSNVSTAEITLEAASGSYDNPTGLQIQLNSLLVTASFKLTLNGLVSEGDNDFSYLAELNGSTSLYGNLYINVQNQPLIITNTIAGKTYGGTFNPTTSTATLTDQAKVILNVSSSTLVLTNSTAQQTGYPDNASLYYLVTTGGSFASLSFNQGDTLTATSTGWVKIDNTSQGGKITIASEPAISVQANYIGDRIDSDEINAIDQVIIDKYNHFTTYIEYKQPEIIQTHLNVKVKYKTNATINNVRQNIKTNINKLFDISPIYLGKTLKLSDIYNTVVNTEGVDYCLITKPTANITALQYQFIVLSSLTIEDII